MSKRNSLVISVQTQDRKIYRKDLLAFKLLQAKYENLDVDIDFYPEGSCAESLGLYRMLDEFCKIHEYDPARITVNTANLVEHHDRYCIIRQPSYWYEIDQIKTWLNGQQLMTGTSPNKHFGCFVSRSTWARLWISTYLDQHHRDQTIQTYHYDRGRENYNGNGYVGLDDLFQFDCDIIPDCADFLMTCPRTIDLEFLKQCDTSTSPFQHTDSYYPIQVPANLNLLQYYHDIFVDIVTEPNVSGNNFLATEKLWRCIVAKRPFIVLASSDYLLNLGRLGFKTFWQYWDESYDGLNNQTRIRAMIRLIDSIANYSKDQLGSMLMSMQPILDHNYQTFMALDTQQINKVFNQVSL